MLVAGYDLGRIGRRMQSRKSDSSLRKLDAVCQPSRCGASWQPMPIGSCTADDPYCRSRNRNRPGFKVPLEVMGRVSASTQTLQRAIRCLSQEPSQETCCELNVAGLD